MRLHNGLKSVGGLLYVIILPRLQNKKGVPLHPTITKNSEINNVLLLT